MMDRKYIANESIVERYMAGELTVREAREFEKYCLEHPDVLNDMPIPVRLKAKLAKRPADDSETGIFQAMPSSTARAAVEINDEGFDVEEEQAEWRRRFGGGANSRPLIIGLGVALIAAVVGVIVYGMQARSLAEKLQKVQREAQATQMQAPGGVQTYRVQMARAKPDQATLALGWMQPPQLLELRIDATEGKYNVFQITIDKADGSRVMQIRRIARDSNRELRMALNSSAFGPGEYLMRIDGYTWRGQAMEVGWVRVDLR